MPPVWFFCLFDLNASRSLDLSEFREVFRFFLGHKPTEAELVEECGCRLAESTSSAQEWTRLISQDTVGSDAVSFQQYLSWLKESDNPVFHQYDASDDTPVSSPVGSPAVPSRAVPSPVRGRGAKARPTSMLSASASRELLRARPKWNPRFNDGPNMNEKKMQHDRRYFSRPQTEKELLRFYNTFSGFEKQYTALHMPAPEQRLVTTCPRVLSSEHEDVLLSHIRHSPGGEMRSRSAGTVVRWDDHWPIPKCLKERRSPSDRPKAPFATFSEPERFAPKAFRA